MAHFNVKTLSSLKVCALISAQQTAVGFPQQPVLGANPQDLGRNLIDQSIISGGLGGDALIVKK